MVTPESVLGLVRKYRYAAMSGVLLISAMGVPIPEEAILIASGLAVGWEGANFWLASLACVLGIVGGDIFIFSMGRLVGRRLLAARPVRWIFSAKRQATVERLFARHGSKTVFFGRFLTGVRFGIFLYAGQHGMSPGRFLALDLPGALISGPATILLGAFAARQVADPRQAVELARHWLAEGYLWIYAIMAAVVAALLARWLLRRRRDAIEPETERSLDAGGEREDNERSTHHG